MLGRFSYLALGFVLGLIYLNSILPKQDQINILLNIAQNSYKAGCYESKKSLCSKNAQAFKEAIARAISD